MNASRSLIHQPIPPALREEWTHALAEQSSQEHQATRAAFVFRLRDEWFCIDTGAVQEIAPLTRTLPIPHARPRAAASITNIRGAITLCIDLASLLECTGESASGPQARLLVLRRKTWRVACVAHEISGIIRFETRDERPLPSTFSATRQSLSQSIFDWAGRSVAHLQADPLFESIRRSLK